MKNNGISDFVAATMDAVLKSEDHQSLFKTNYKFASDENDAKTKAKKKEVCPECDQDQDKCYCGDSSMAKDHKAKMHKDKMHKAEKAEKEELKSTAGFDIAIDSLLTASAALDSVGMENSATFSLKLASLVVEAKKAKKKEDAKKPAKDSKESSKKSDSSSSESASSKKSDSASSKVSKKVVLKKKAAEEHTLMAVCDSSGKVLCYCPEEHCEKVCKALGCEEKDCKKVTFLEIASEEAKKEESNESRY